MHDDDPSDDPPEAPYEAGDHDALPWIPTGDPKTAPEELGDPGPEEDA